MSDDPEKPASDAPPAAPAAAPAARARVPYRWAKLALAIAMVALGFDLFHPRTPLLRFGPPLLLLIGLFWAVSLIFLAGLPEGAARTQRFKSAAATLIAVVAVVLGATLIRLGPSVSLQRLNAGLGDGLSAQSADPELGWAPMGKGRVGQHLDTIDPAREHVLLMGDSVLYGWGIGETEHVGRRLGEKMPRYQVLNASVSGYSIDQYYLYLKRISPEVRPKQIVVGIFTGNDYQITGREFSWGTSKPLFTVQNGELVRSNEGASCIDDLSQSLLFRTLWRSRETAMGMIESFCKPRQLRRSEVEAVIAKLFDGIEAIGKEYGNRPLFVLLPVRDEYNLFDRERFLYGSKYRDLRRLLVEGKHDMLEPLPAVQLENARVKEGLYLEDHAHFTARGHEILAEEIAKELAKRGLVP
ncbi:MAG: SGNH/GDSL hydrolase family protein [Byssovorax sp.]